LSEDNPENLPEKAMTPEERERRRLAALAEGALRFRKLACDTLDHLMCEMIADNCEMAGEKFRTVNGRNVMLVLAFGDDAVGALTDKLFEIENPPEQSGDAPDRPEDDPDFWKKK
jgi:hypothetical protein